MFLTVFVIFLEIKSCVLEHSGVVIWYMKTVAIALRLAVRVINLYTKVKERANIRGMNTESC